MNREEVLTEAARAVLQDRNTSYGGPEDSFNLIADLWTAYLQHPVDAHDVVMLMALLKIARARNNPAHADNHVDLAGYASCAAEIAETMTEGKV